MIRKQFYILLFQIVSRRPSQESQQQIVARKYSSNTQQQPQQVVYQNRQNYPLIAPSSTYNILTTTNAGALLKQQQPTLDDLRALETDNQNALVTELPGYVVVQPKQQVLIRNSNKNVSVSPIQQQDECSVNSPIVLTPRFTDDNSNFNFLHEKMSPSSNNNDLLHENDAMLMNIPSAASTPIGNVAPTLGFNLFC